MKTSGSRRFRFLVLSMLSVWITPCFSAIYQCIDENGVSYFSDHGCPVKPGAKRVDQPQANREDLETEIDTSLFEEALKTPPGFGQPNPEDDSAPAQLPEDTSQSPGFLLQILLILLIAVVVYGSYKSLKRARQQVIRLSSTNNSFSTCLEMSDIFQGNLEQIREETKGIHLEILKDARLITRGNNMPYKQAVRVDIDGLTVGFLNRQEALTFRKEIKKLDVKNRPLVCSAKISDNWKHALEGKPRFTVFLDLLDLPLPKTTKATKRSRREPVISGGKNTATNRPGKTFSFNLVIDISEYPGIKKGDAVSFISVADALVVSLKNKPDQKYQSLGLTPENFAGAIRDHQAQGLPVEARVSGIKNGFITIQCKRVSVEEYENHLIDEKTRLKRELAKKFFPKKPFSIEIYSSSNNFSVGDELNILAAPTLDDMIDGKKRVEVLFDKDDLEDFLAMNQDMPAIKKIYRLVHTHNRLNIRVTSKENVAKAEDAEPRYRYLLAIFPMKREVS